MRVVCLPYTAGKGKNVLFLRFGRYTHICYSAKYLHRKYMELLEQYMIPEDKIAEIEKKKRGVKYKYGVGK